MKYRMSTKKVHFSFPVSRAKVNFFCGHPVAFYLLKIKPFLTTGAVVPREVPPAGTLVVLVGFGVGLEDAVLGLGSRVLTLTLHIGLALFVL